MLVLDREPPSDYWAWEWFASRKMPKVMWVDEDELQTFIGDADWLVTLLGSNESDLQTSST